MDFEKFLRKTVCQLKVFNNNKVSKMNHFTNQKKMTIFFFNHLQDYSQIKTKYEYSGFQRLITGMLHNK